MACPRLQGAADSLLRSVRSEMQQVPVRRGKATDAGPRRVDVKGASWVGGLRDGASGEAEVTRRFEQAAVRGRNECAPSAASAKRIHMVE